MRLLTLRCARRSVLRRLSRDPSVSSARQRYKYSLSECRSDTFQVATAPVTNCAVIATANRHRSDISSSRSSSRSRRRRFVRQKTTRSFFYFATINYIFFLEFSVVRIGTKNHSTDVKQVSSWIPQATTCVKDNCCEKLCCFFLTRKAGPKNLL